jgi:phosphoribosylanthranilate isomerase
VKRTRIKICSICRPADARLAAGAGADAVGMILHPPSKRNVEIDAARTIVQTLPPFVTPVGVFVDAGADRVREVARAIGLRHVQLHGQESEADIAALPEFAVVKAVKVAGHAFRQELARWEDIATRHPNLLGIVLETAGTDHAGGTGVANDWTLIADVLASHHGRLSVIAAGGLKPDTVADVVRRLRPFAVDVSSGVEESLGQKSAEKVAAFVAAVRAADAAP